MKDNYLVIRSPDLQEDEGMGQLIGRFETKEQAEKVRKEWKNDPFYKSSNIFLVYHR